jgi:hypothetical protein
MRKLLTLLLLLNTGVVFSQTGVKTNLGGLAEVTFPSKPANKDLGNQEVNFLKDSTAMYLTYVKDLGKEVGFSLMRDSLNEFYAGIIEGTIKSSGGRVIYKKNIEINGLPAIECEYTLTNPNLPGIGFQRTIFLNKKLINCTFLTTEENIKINESKKDQFFGSIAIIADKSTIKQYTNEDSAYKAGYSIGYILGVIIGLGIIVLIVVGAVFLIKRVTTRKKP